MFGFARLSVAGAAVASLAIAAPAFANANYMLSLRGEVPTICRAQIEGLVPVEAGSDMTGTLKEFCNSAAGYKVYATASDEALRVNVDGREVAPEADGRFLLATESHANIAARSVTFSGASSGTISITVVAA